MQVDTAINYINARRQTAQTDRLSYRRQDHFPAAAGRARRDSSRKQPGKTVTRSWDAAADSDGMPAQPLHRQAGDAEQKPKKANAKKNSDSARVIKARQQWKPEAPGDDAVSDRREAKQQRHRNAAVRVQIRPLFILEIKPAGNGEKQNHRPTDRDRYRDGHEKG